jgi:hypothetical protein
LRTVLFVFADSQSFVFWFFLHLSLPLLANRRRETRKNTASPESSTDDEESSDSDEENSGDNSDDGSDGDQVPEQEEDSPKVDITG